MADSSEASSSSASGIVLSAELAAERRKKYISERDKTKISLFEHFESWRNLRKQLNLKTDKELATWLVCCWEIILAKPRILLYKGKFL